MKLLQKNSLSRTIFLRTITAILTVSILCVLVSVTVLYAIFLDETGENLRSETAAVAAGVEYGGAGYLEGIPVRSDVRITWIAADGQVLFDTDSDPALMDNHADRPEFLEALETGSGTARRVSGTLSDWVVYRAVRISDGSVVRLCLLESSPFSMLAQSAIPLAVLLLVAIVAAVIVAAGTVSKIVPPINQIDLKEPEKTPVYTELLPLTCRIQAQNQQIQQNMEQMQLAHEEQDRFRREFTANVSHELKTPLTSISGFAEIIRDGMVRPEDIPHFAGTIYQEAQRLILLVGDIIKISRMDEHAVPLQKEPVDPYDLCEIILERLTPQAEKNGVQLHLEGSHAQISGSCQIVDEMIYNLCDNAIKYNRPGGHVYVSVTQEAAGVKLSVRDTGIGIPEAHQDRVFERFYRVDKNRSRQIGGTGLGLSIVKHGAIFHEADLKLTSTPGVGTEITVTFPNP